MIIIVFFSVISGKYKDFPIESVLNCIQIWKPSWISNLAIPSIIWSLPYFIIFKFHKVLIRKVYPFYVSTFTYNEESRKNLDAFKYMYRYKLVKNSLMIIIVFFSVISGKYKDFPIESVLNCIQIWKPSWISNLAIPSIIWSLGYLF
jgi:hypothetical protein